MTWEEEWLRNNLCLFPKYGRERRTWYDIIQQDRDYVQFLIDNVEMNEDSVDALTWGVQHVPDRIG